MTSLNRWIHILGSPVNYPSSPCHNWHSENTEVSRQRAAVGGSSLSKGPLAFTKLFCFFLLCWQLRKRFGFLWLYCFANIFISGLASVERSCFGIFHIPLEHWTSFVSGDINSLEVPQGLWHPFKKKQYSIPAEVQEFVCMINSWHISVWDKLTGETGFACPYFSQGKSC